MSAMSPHGPHDIPPYLACCLGLVTICRLEKKSFIYLHIISIGELVLLKLEWCHMLGLCVSVFVCVCVGLFFPLSLIRIMRGGGGVVDIFPTSHHARNV